MHGLNEMCPTRKVCFSLHVYLSLSNYLSLSLFLSLFLKNMHGFNEKFVSLISYYLLIINY